MGQCAADVAGTDDGIGHGVLFKVNGCSGREGGDVLQGLRDGGLPCIGVQGEPFGAHHGRVCHAQKRQQRQQIALLVLKGRALRARRVDAAARRGDERLLADQQAFGAGGRVAEGLASDRDPVDPGLQRRRDGQVVHRRPDHHDVRREELRQVGVALDQVGGDDLVLNLCTLPCGHVRASEVQGRVGRQVAVDDVQARVQGLLPRDDFGGKLAADGGRAENAGIQVKQLHGQILSVNALWGEGGRGFIRISTGWSGWIGMVRTNHHLAKTVY